MKLLEKILVIVTILVITALLLTYVNYTKSTNSIDALKQEKVKLEEKLNKTENEIIVKKQELETKKNTEKVVEYEKWQKRNEKVKKLF